MSLFISERIISCTFLLYYLSNITFISFSYYYIFYLLILHMIPFLTATYSYLLLSFFFWYNFESTYFVLCPVFCYDYFLLSAVIHCVTHLYINYYFYLSSLLFFPHLNLTHCLFKFCDIIFSPVAFYIIFFWYFNSDWDFLVFILNSHYALTSVTVRSWDLIYSVF